MVRQFVSVVAQERGWPENWLNDAAKGFLTGVSATSLIFTSPGLHVRRPSIEQLLAMKLCAWRDDTDISDAARLLDELSGERGVVWGKIEPHLQFGMELKARYAFDDLWDNKL